MFSKNAVQKFFSLLLLLLLLFANSSSAVFLNIFGNSQCVNESLSYGPMFNDTCLQNAEGINIAMKTCNPTTREVLGATFTDDLCTSEPTNLGPVSTTSCAPFNLPGGIAPNIPIPGCDLSKDCKPYMQLDSLNFYCQAPNKFYSLQLWDNTACLGDGPTDWITLDGKYCAVNGLPETISKYLPSNLYSIVLDSVIGQQVSVTFFPDSSCNAPVPIPPSLVFSKLGACLVYTPVPGLQFGMKLVKTPVFPAQASATPTPKGTPSITPSISPSASPSLNVTKTPTNSDPPIVTAGNNAVSTGDLRTLIGVVSGSFVIFAIAGCACLYFISKGRSNNNILTSVSAREIAEFNQWKKEGKKPVQGSGGTSINFYPVEVQPMTRDQRFHSILHLNQNTATTSTTQSIQSTTKTSYEPSSVVR